MAAETTEIVEFEVTTDQLEAAAKRAEGAFDHLGDRAAQATAKWQASLERSLSIYGSVDKAIDRTGAAFDRLRAKSDPVFAAQLRAEKEMAAAIGVTNRAVRMHLTTEEEAAAEIAKIRNRQIADIARVKEAQLRGAAANQNVAGNRFAALNVANQFQDIGITAAMGQSIGTIALQQGTQVGAGLQMALGDKGAAGAVKILGAAFTSLLNPVMLASVAFVGLIAAGIKFVDWGHVATSVLTFVADILPKVADYAAAAGAGLAVLYAPAILGGLTMLSEAILGVTARLVGLAIGFAAANPGVAFVLGITAIVAALNIFRDDITKTFGVDVVGAVNDGANKVIGLFVGAYEYVANTWRQLPDLLSGLARMAINDLIDEFSKPWLTVNGKVLIGGFDTSSMKTQLTDAEKKAIAGGSATFGDAMSRNYTGEFASGIAKGAAYATDKIKDLIKGIDTVDAKSKKHHGKTDEEKFEDIVTSANNKIAAMQAEQAGLGMTELASAKLRYETELLNEAKRKDITLTASQRDQLIGLADQMAETAIQTKHAKEALDFAKDASKGFLDTLRQGLESGKGFWKSFGDAALGVLNKIIDKIETDLIDALYDVKNAGGGGGLGSLIMKGVNWLFGVGGGGFPTAIGGVAPTGTFGGGLYADGGYTGSGSRYDPAGIVHKGEIVWSQSDIVRAGGVDVVEAMRRGLSGYDTGGQVSLKNSGPVPSGECGAEMVLAIGGSK